MIRLLAYSGGADSGALAVWLMQQGIDYTPVFCDTKWEHELTYEHIERFNREIFGGKLVRIESKKYYGMRGLVERKGRVPSSKARFCTEQLKIIPMQAYIQSLDDEAMVYQGIRADESESRASASMREWSDIYDTWVERPILRWTKAEVFELHKRHSIPINPLYKMGAGRVGCFPCVLVNQGELKRLTETQPQVWARIGELEMLADGRSFFPPNYIPWSFQRGRYIDRSGKTWAYPEAMDVRGYVQNEDQLNLIQTENKCMSIYNICE